MEPMIGFVVWFSLAIAVAVIAATKNRSAFGYFILGLLLPIVSVVLAIGVTKKPTAQQLAASQGEPAWKRRPCPMCAERIVISASKCRFCGADVKPVGAIRNWLGF